jgi:hypothetical protein
MYSALRKLAGTPNPVLKTAPAYAVFPRRYVIPSFSSRLFCPYKVPIPKYSALAVPVSDWIRVTWACMAEHISTDESVARAYAHVIYSMLPHQEGLVKTAPDCELIKAGIAKLGSTLPTSTTLQQFIEVGIFY